MVAQQANFSLKELKQAVYDWLSFLRIVTTPENYNFDDENFQKFDLLTLKTRIRKLKENDILKIKVNSQCGEFHLYISKLSIHERTILDRKVFLNYQSLMEDYFDTKMKKNGVYAFIRALDEQLYNNVENIAKRTFESNTEIRMLPKRYNNKKEVIVDCNRLAGYDIYFQDLCLTSCWKMYYSSEYFKLIPQEIFLEVQQVHEVEELDNKVIKIALFKDPFNWNLPVNLDYQRLFRDQIGFDQFTWSNGIGVLRPLYIEYAFTKNNIQIVQYQNKFFQPVEKRNATNFVTRNYDLATKKVVVHRTQGSLNAKAYFPWMNTQKKQMVAYHIIDPERAIDNGLCAYEFYIRQVFDIEVIDSKYIEFSTILRFYLPKKTIKNVPLEELYKQLSDVEISNLKQDVERTEFDIKNKKNHLKVVFLDDQQLNLSPVENKQ